MFGLNTYFNILTFRIPGINLSWGISHRIKELKVRRFDEDGYVEFDTNIGVEAMDIIDEDLVNESQKRKIQQYLRNAKRLEVKIDD